MPLESKKTCLSTIIEAQKRITNYVHRTPIFSCESITKRSNFKAVYLKCENFQKIGAFKIRGAMNAVKKCLESYAGCKKSVLFVTHSSGNHAQAVALACSSNGVSSHIIMPSNAPQQKKDATLSYGARITFCSPTLQDRELTTRRILEENMGNGYQTYFIHPYDDYSVMDGQGTIGLEIHEQVSTNVSTVIIPVGGGGLLAGVSTALKALRPDIYIVAAEPFGADDAAKSVREGILCSAHEDGKPNTIADGLLTTLSQRTFEIIREKVDEFCCVTEDEIIEALRFVLERSKLVIEPSAAVGVAALLSNRIKGPLNVNQFDSEAVVLLCGGNLDFLSLSGLLTKSGI